MTSNRQLREVGHFPSSSSSKVYVVKEDQAGNLSCDCPAWRFKKPNQERTCKHVESAAAGNIPAPPAQPAAPTDDWDPDEVMAELMAETEKTPKWKPLSETRGEMGETPTQ